MRHISRVAAVLLALILLASPVQAEKKKISTKQTSSEVSPILTFQDRMRELSQDCAHDPNSPGCVAQRKLLKEEYSRLRDLCREKPESDVCGAVVHKKMQPGVAVEQKCIQQPQALACQKWAERKKKREKKRILFCKKNPNERRCLGRTSKHRTYASIGEFCKVNPEKPVCKSIAEKRDRGKPKAPEEGNAF